MIKLLCKLVELNAELLEQLGETVTRKPDREMIKDAKEVMLDAECSLEDLEHR
jgi:hypothetical protein